MITCIKNGTLVLHDTTVRKNLYTDGEKIVAVTAESLPCNRTVDATGLFVSPGFIDIHVHGDGFEFIDGTKEAVLRAAAIHAAHGTTTLYPTLSAYKTGRITAALDAIRRWRNDAALHIAGVHLEGPYLSPRQSGAQAAACMHAPDPAEYTALINAYGDLIARITYAPELDGAVAFQNFLREKGIVGAVGHSNAQFADVQKAYAHGCRLVTHLYSCTSTVTRHGGFRAAGVVESAYLLDDMYAEAIADGCHLPPELLQLIYKIKGAAHTCLVTDAIRFGGMQHCEGEIVKNGVLSYVIEDGVAKLTDRSAFAGSIATADILLKTCVQTAKLPLCAAVRMLTATPAAAMGLKNKGALFVGYDADIVLFDEDFTVRRVFISGK